MPAATGVRQPLAASVALSLALMLASCSPAASPAFTSPPSAGRPSTPLASSTPMAVPSDPISSGVTSDALRVHLAALDAIATEHGGNRSVGTAGFDASLAYAEQALAAAGYRVERQEFRVPVWQDPGGSELAITGRSAAMFKDGRDFLAMWYSPAGSVEGPLVVMPVPCEAGAFEGMAAGSMVLVREGTGCAQDIGEAAEAGAIAVIVAESRPPGSLLRYPVRADDVSVPAIVVSDQAARTLETAAGVAIRLRTTGETRPATTHNLIAELAGSDPSRVVMLGAHLDSAIDSPGIDDNGTGVAAVLEIARVLGGSGHAATIRFALWSSEEIGLRGSAHYVDILTHPERARIGAYLNADMLGARNWIRAMYLGEGDLAETAAIGSRLSGYFTQQGERVDSAAVLGATDAASFSRARIPAAGVITIDIGAKTDGQARDFGGIAGQPGDACRHLACDDLTNVDLGIAVEMSRALGTALIDLASSRAAASAQADGSG